MALSKKSLTLLKKIYDHHKGKELVKEDPDEALEYVLEEIVGQLSDPDSDSAPLYVVTEDAVGRLHVDRYKRREAEQQAARQAQEAETS